MLGDLAMGSTMEYKGYVGDVEFAEDKCLFYGKFQGIQTEISYEGQTASELVDGFHRAVD